MCVCFLFSQPCSLWLTRNSLKGRLRKLIKTAQEDTQAMETEDILCHAVDVAYLGLGGKQDGGYT